MSMSSIPCNKPAFDMDLDKMMMEGARTERQSEPVALEKKYTFNVKVEEEPRKSMKTEVKKFNPKFKEDMDSLLEKEV
jgi:hypothetical protein